MSDERPLIRKPKGTPVISYEGPKTIHTASGEQHLMIKTDRRFFGEPDCFESCRLVSAKSGDIAVNFNSFILQGSTEGVFEEPSEGSGSVWRFNITFATGRLYRPQERHDARSEGLSSITKTVELEFLHEGIEHISYALPPGRELSPLEEVLREQKTFVKTSTFYVLVDFVCRFTTS